jgi:hypothetical protein
MSRRSYRNWLLLVDDDFGGLYESGEPVDVAIGDVVPFQTRDPEDLARAEGRQDLSG